MRQSMFAKARNMTYQKPHSGGDSVHFSAIQDVLEFLFGKSVCNFDGKYKFLWIYLCQMSKSFLMASFIFGTFVGSVEKEE